MSESLLGGLVILGFTFLFIGIIIFKVRKIYKETKKERENEKEFFYIILHEKRNQTKRQKPYKVPALIHILRKRFL